MTFAFDTARHDIQRFCKINISQVADLRFAFTLILVVSLNGAAVSAESSFRFAGFSVDTTIAALEDRYPTSSKSDSHIYVSDTDVQNHVYGISISKDRVRLSFEKRLDTGILAYPACKLVLDQLIELNERPATVQEFFEEIVRSRRIIWRNETEEMILFCFEKDGRYLVEAVSFYKS